MNVKRDVILGSILVSLLLMLAAVIVPGEEPTDGQYDWMYKTCNGPVDYANVVHYKGTFNFFCPDGAKHTVPRYIR